MADRGIIFSGPMVRALLEGRKTQTRRVLRPQPPFSGGIAGGVTSKGAWAIYPARLGGPGAAYGRTFARGDSLWARESWRTGLAYEDLAPSEMSGEEHILFEADGFDVRWTPGSSEWGRLRPSIHMPRWASRITLLVTNVRVERLQDISEADARAEGAPPAHGSIDKISREFGYPDWPRSWFAQTWESLHGAGAWDANPWVAAISFAVEARNIDA